MVKASKKTTQTRIPKAAKAKDQFIRRLLREFSEGDRWHKIRDETLEFFNGRCAYCRKKVEKLQVDHAFPIKEYLGTSRNGNLIPACPTCNGKKRD